LSVKVVSELLLGYDAANEFSVTIWYRR
jgi:hypothetical protein